MALVELYRTTGESKYLDFTRYLFSGVERDRLKLKDSEIKYMFSGKPFTSRTEFEGHAVRALYAAAGATDYFAESGDPAFRKTLDLLWTDLTARKMYITGGVGSRSGGESFGDPYELPSEQAYAETCAAIANVMWNFRLLSHDRRCAVYGRSRTCSLQWREFRSVAFGHAVLLPESVGFEWRKASKSLVRHDLLSTQH